MTTSPTHGRLARPADFDSIQPLIERFYREEDYAEIDQPRAMTALRTLLASPELGSVWLAERDGVAIGYAVICYGFSLEHRGRDAFLDEFFVEKFMRGQGIGNALLDAAEASAIAAGVGVLHLEVERNNERAAALYVRRGYRGNARSLLSKKLS
ncbi:MAG: ribosomal protein S18 acetylase RimI-like enzyme [Hyphomicrobiaceae bacterium]|jgi:ribosomal protein S18 acetylase RimI-like enzyme